MAAAEALVILGVIAGITYIARVIIKNRAEERRRRAETRAKLEAAKGAEDIVQTLLVDREMATEIHKRLGTRLAQKQ